MALVTRKQRLSRVSDLFPAVISKICLIKNVAETE